MIVNFRQGIINAEPNGNYLSFSNNKINLNVDSVQIDIAFAYGQTDYLFSEIEDVVGAWGPFSSGTNYWLYWDIDNNTGVRTFGSTTIAPTFGISYPLNPLVGQHFFNLNDKKMKVWNGFSWDDKIRVFAANIVGGSSVITYAFGSQVGLSGNYSIGYILFDVNNNPITRTIGSYNAFLTTEDKVHTQYDTKNSYKIDGLLIDGTAKEPIPAFHALSWKGPRELGVASYINYTYPCIGISVEASGKNQINKFITKGFLTNYNNWNWTESPNTPLFVGATGEITTQVPQNYSLQKIGHIVAPDTIFVDIQEIILIESSPVITPSPSATLTVTPSISATASITPTITSTTTPSATLTVTPTPSTSISITPSITPTLTPAVSETPRPSPVS